MQSKSGFIAAVAASVIMVIGAGALVTHARAAGGAGPNTLCTSTSPCLTESNTSSGDGVEGTSAKGAGLDGRTSAKGSTPANAGVGMTGTDTRTTPGTGIYNIGVKGVSANGTAVFGSSTNAVGVSGAGGSFGVDGTGFNAGVLGSSALYGVEGQATGAGVNVYANSLNSGAYLFEGNNASANNVFIVDNSGDTMIGGAASISSNATVGGGGAFDALDVDSDNTSEDGISVNGYDAGVFASTGPGGGSGGEAGVIGDNNTTSTAVLAYGNGGLLYSTNNTASADVFDVDDSGNIHMAGLIYTSGACSGGCINGRPDSRLATYAPREATPTMEDVGEAQLTAGQGYVRLEPSFAKIIDQHTPYIVFVTPEGDSKGLYVTQKSLAGFMVRENQGGSSTLAFSYRIIAKPFGVSAQRLAPMVVRKMTKYYPRMRMPAAITHTAKLAPAR